MTHTTSISVARLRRASELIFDELEARQGPVIDLANDYFWWIPAEQRFNPYEVPSSFTMGQLTECVDHLNTALDGDPSQAVFSMVWLGQLLEGIASADV